MIHWAWLFLAFWSGMGIGWLILSLLIAGKVEPIQRCRVCGCTDEDCSECIAKTGEPCYWVEPDLCSACAPATENPA